MQQVRRCAGIGSACRRTDQLREWCFRASGCSAEGASTLCVTGGTFELRRAVHHRHWCRCRRGSSRDTCPKKNSRQSVLPRAWHYVGSVRASVRVCWAERCVVCGTSRERVYLWYERAPARACPLARGGRSSGKKVTDTGPPYTHFRPLLGEEYWFVKLGRAGGGSTLSSPPTVRGCSTGVAHAGGPRAHGMPTHVCWRWQVASTETLHRGAEATIACQHLWLQGVISSNMRQALALVSTSQADKPPCWTPMSSLIMWLSRL